MAKFATYARDISDAATVLRALRSAPCPTIALAMGERGQLTRLLAPKYGGFLTFGALSEGRASAPGQPTLRALRELYGLQRQGPATKVFGVVGNPVNHRWGGKGGMSRGFLVPSARALPALRTMSGTEAQPILRSHLH